MSDFYLDFRPLEQRVTKRAASFLKFYPDVKVFEIEEPAFSFVLTRCDDVNVWGPYQSPDNRLLVALAGRLAFESQEWESAKNIAGKGGLACKAVAQRYSNRGAEGIKDLNGNFAVFIYDRPRKKFIIMNDRCGSLPVYHWAEPNERPTFCSHDDLLAVALGCSQELDETSLAQFISVGRVTCPYTFYRRIRGAQLGSIYEVELNGDRPTVGVPRAYFRLEFRIDERITEREMAEQLAAAIDAAVKRRSLPLFGKTAVALSGGLDSRTILGCCRRDADVVALNFYDEENQELRNARAIGTAMGVPFIAFRRTAEYYAETAGSALRINGGMGIWNCNLFLGFRERLLEQGINNILTGFACDMLFKGLTSDRRCRRFLRSYKAGSFFLQYDQPVYSLPTKAGRSALERLEAVFPASLRQLQGDTDRLEVEARRVFPLCVWGDNTSTTLPQRVLPWFLPIADNQILNVYMTTPPRMKYNASMYRKAVASLWEPKVSRIPDSNTGANINAGVVELLMRHYWERARERLRSMTRAEQANTSRTWFDWTYYVQHSSVIRQLWLNDNQEARRILTDLMGMDPFDASLSKCRTSGVDLSFCNSFSKPTACESEICEYGAGREPDILGAPVDLMFRLSTLKIWLDVRLR